METVESFAARVLAHTGLPLAAIPDGEDADLICGSIACARGGSTVVLVDHSHQDEGGTDWYRRAVVVGRTDDLPPAWKDATGTIGHGESFKAGIRAGLEGAVEAVLAGAADSGCSEDEYGMYVAVKAIQAIL